MIMKWVKTSELKRWLTEGDSHLTLPHLYRRLITATVPSINQIRFSSGDFINNEGWDGILTCEKGNEFVPDGEQVDDILVIGIRF
jgi:hypothetical protein